MNQLVSDPLRLRWVLKVIAKNNDLLSIELINKIKVIKINKLVFKVEFYLLLHHSIITTKREGNFAVFIQATSYF